MKDNRRRRISVEQGEACPFELCQTININAFIFSLRRLLQLIEHEIEFVFYRIKIICRPFRHFKVEPALEHVHE